MVIILWNFFLLQIPTRSDFLLGLTCPLTDYMIVHVMNGIWYPQIKITQELIWENLKFKNQFLKGCTKISIRHRIPIYPTYGSLRTPSPYWPRSHSLQASFFPLIQPIDFFQAQIVVICTSTAQWVVRQDSTQGSFSLCNICMHVVLPPSKGIFKVS